MNALASFLTSRARRLTGRADGLRYVYLETHGVCPNRCGMCPARAGGKRRPRMGRGLFESIVRELGERGFDGELHLYGHNEPLLDPRIFELAGLAHALAPKAKIMLISNFTRLRQGDVERLLAAPLSRLTVSLYAADAQTYERVCGTGRFETVLENVKRFALAWSRRRPFAFSASILRSEALADPEAARRLLETLPVSWWSMPPAVSLRGLTGTVPETAWRFGECLFDTVKITGDGAVTPCMVDPDAALRIGHAARDGLYASFDGERARALRRELFFTSGESRPTFCRHCAYARDHKILYFLMPDGARSRLLERLDPGLKAASAVSQHFNTREETTRKAQALARELEATRTGLGRTPEDARGEA